MMSESIYISIHIAKGTGCTFITIGSKYSIELDQTFKGILPNVTHI